MKNRLPLLLLAFACLITPAKTWATNGDNMIAIGPIARGMGGLSIAYPQDAISAVFGNPAAMCFGAYCPGSQFDFAGTAFMPTVDASISNPFDPTQTIAADSDEKIYPIPAIGLSLPFGENDRWRFGLAAYGVSGLGVDYRQTNLHRTFGDIAPGPIPDQFVPNPIIAGHYTSLQIMKSAPSVAYMISENFSLGGSFHIDYATLDLAAGSSPGFGFGVQLGALWRPVPNVALGLVYTSPQEVDHEDVVSLGPTVADLSLEAPQQVGAGVSLELADRRVVLGAEAKFINWADANGYSDFDWEDQWVLALGAQFAVIPEKFFIRAGWNYGENPVKANQGWDGSFNPQTGMPNDVVYVQGTPFPRYYYETFRIVGFPAIVESHLTFGFSYAFNDKFMLSLSYMHAFENTITENGTGPLGAPTTIESSLSEDSLEFGLSWRF